MSGSYRVEDEGWFLVINLLVPGYPSAHEAALLWWTYVGMGFLFFVMAIMYHEAGHLMILRERFKKARINWRKGELSVGEEWMYDKLQPGERVKVYAYGIFLGLIPLWAMTMTIPILLSLPYMAAYAIGILSDIKNIKQARKEMSA